MIHSQVIQSFTPPPPVSSLPPGHDGVTVYRVSVQVVDSPDSIDVSITKHNYHHD